ncbi:remorin 1.4-like [Rhododendron vialii]|uniref:remorin 1.4-like n=1 Tax=Rhododendron vialii TaxID=182163 RepID=UPI00265DFDF5|nr:remorin 1.4-like [Rhododendron vialii]
MGSEENKKIESEATPSVPQEASANEQIPKDPPSENIPEATVAKGSDPAPQKKPGDSNDRDAALTRVMTEKRLALIKAWEESEKSKKENKAHRKLSEIGSWEKSRKASIEAELKQIEELFEKKKAEYAERMNNKKAEIHKDAEEKRAMVEAKRGEEFVQIEEAAAKHRSTGTTPKILFGCCGF